MPRKMSIQIFLEFMKLPALLTFLEDECISLRLLNIFWFVNDTILSTSVVFQAVLDLGSLFFVL